jgi:NAD(P)-dependent dehydrogenase (short-subunit alcohol dehydrogenase family)
MYINYKTILITGSTDGIGKVTAKALAKQGHRVIVHGRNAEKAAATCTEIKNETGNANVDFLIADLLLLSDIKQMAADLKAKYERLDVLINNAGAVFGKNRELTGEGLEKTMTLNVFAPMLLSYLLLDLLAQSPAARIVNVASAAHKMGGKPDLNDIQLTKKYSFSAAYGQSKLYMIWLTQHLAEELKKTGIRNITVNSLHPGMIKTDFGQNTDKGWLGNLLFKMAVPLFGITPQQGAETTIYLATSKEVENVSGNYFSKKKIDKPDTRFYSQENEQLIWDYTMSIIKPYL